MDVLYWYYEESKSYADVIGEILKRFGDSNFKPKYRIDVIQQLLQQVIGKFSKSWLLRIHVFFSIQSFNRINF